MSVRPHLACALSPYRSSCIPLGSTTVTSPSQVTSVLGPGYAPDPSVTQAVQASRGCTRSTGHLPPCPPTAPAHLQLPLPLPGLPWEAATHHFFQLILNLPVTSAIWKRTALEGRRQERKAEGKREPQNHCPITSMAGEHTLAGRALGCSGLGTSRWAGVPWGQGEGCLLQVMPPRETGNSRTRTHSCLVSLGLAGICTEPRFSRRG